MAHPLNANPRKGAHTMHTPPKRLLAALVELIAALAGGGALIITAAPDNHGTPPATLTVHVDGLDAGKTPDRTITVPQAAIEKVAPTLEDNLNTAPATTPAGELDAARNAAEKIKATQLPLPTAGATAGFQGCRTSFVTNQSSRHGTRPQVQVLHYTVSPNRPGWTDVDAVVALFNRSSSQASSNFVIDGEGHCAYIVPIEAKAWTQAAGNPFSISYEIIATGKESEYMAPGGLAKLRSVMREVSNRTGIPMRHGAVSNCVPTRTGIVQHKDWGLCGGGHVDISPFPVDKIIGQLVTGGITATDRVTCRKLNYWRTHGRHHGKPEANAIRRKNALTARGVTCTPTHGPIKR